MTRIKQEKTITVSAIVDVKCDVCGDSCKKQESWEVATLDADWGYFSDSDGNYWSIELCENCFYDTLAHLKARCTTNGENLNPKVRQ